MQVNLCKTCGGDLHRVGNHYICQSCGNKWAIDEADDVHVVDRANAWAALRDGNFDHAAELFEIIHEKEPKDHEAYWGLALAVAGIMYVIDYAEHKKVPTCNNISEDSFLNSKNVKKAIELAPLEIAGGYRQQAEHIERIRTEWLQKARKEPPYDIFISYKDSDREHGIDRTQDSVDAQDLYNMLTAEGYKVFFSRISLRDKVSEHYEPYIYNAIKTARVMIVFGERAEYFNSTWIKNEWSRFKKRVEDGEKHPNSLIVVCKNMNPGDLPVALRSRQCLNAGDITFGNDLLRHIDKVSSASKGSEHLEKIKVAGGQIGKKASTIAQNSINKREIGQEGTKTSISEKQSLVLVETYIKEKQWDEADSLLENVLFENPSFAEAIWCKLLITHKVQSNTVLMRVLDRFKLEDYDLVEKALNCASKEFAGRILDLFYQSGKILPNHVREKVYEMILPYRYERRDQRLRENFDWCIANRDFKFFKVLLSALESDDVDEYIEYNSRYIKSTLDHREKRECTDNILAVDEGNRVARMYIFEAELSTSNKIKSIIDAFEDVLKYSENIDADVEEALVLAAAVMNTPLHCEFALQLPKYYTGDMKSLQRPLKTLADRMIAKSFFEAAQSIYNLLIFVDETDVEAFWGVCMAKTHSTTEEQIINSPLLLKDQAEYNKYLSLVNEERRIQCVRLAKKQQTVQRSRRRKKIRVTIEVAVSAVLIAGAVLTFTVILPTMQLKKANEMFLAGNYAGANEIYQKLGDFEDSRKRAETVKAIQQVQSGNQADAIRTLLGQGVPVEVTYQTEGGYAKELATAALGYTLSLDSSIIPLSLGVDVRSADSITQTYNSTDSFADMLTLERDGYSFVKWTTESFSYDITGADPVFHLSVKAEWGPEQYVLNYNLDGGSFEGTPITLYSVEDENFTLTIPQKYGYDFLGWILNPEDTPEVNLTIPKGSFGNRTYKAIWKAKEITVTLNYGGGLESGETKLVFGHEYDLSVPENLKPGYRFIGWSDETESRVTETGIWNDAKEAVTLHGRWAPIPYTITYHLEGGKNSAENPITYTVESALTLKAPTRLGYVFMGWGLSAEDASPVKEVTIPAGSVENREYYAIWKEDPCTITLEAGEKATCAVTELVVVYGKEMTLPMPVWEGHTFKGWYLNGNEVTSGACMLVEDCTLVARWDADTFSITYDLGGGTNHAQNPSTYTYDEEIIVHAPERFGYTFLGWTYDGQTTPKLDVKIEKASTGNRSFTARWEAITSTIILDASGGNCEGEEMTVTFDSAMTLPTPQFEGHNFLGWYVGETKVESGNCALAEDMTLVARWESIEYTITYENMQNGTNAVENPNKYTYEDAVTLLAPSRNGYIFLGWTFEGQTEPISSVTIAVGEIGNKTYTVAWAPKEYTVTLQANGGTVETEEQTVIFDQAYMLPIPTRTGYDFVGWYAGETVLPANGVWRGLDNVTAVAKWEACIYSVTLEDVREYDNTRTITLDPNYDGATVQAKTFTSGETLSYLFPEERDGYVFAGWFTSSACDGAPYDFTANLVEDVTLYAKWIEVDSNCDGTIGINGQLDEISFVNSNELFFAFVSPVTQQIEIHTTHTSGDPLLELLDVNRNLLTDDDDTYGSGDADIVWIVEAGQVYYIGYTGWESGVGSLYLEGSQTVGGGVVVAGEQNGLWYDVGSNTTLDITFGEEVILPTPSREGYTFLGWFADDNPVESGTWTLDGDITLTARWEANA